jgi:hypothetical protein
VIGEELARTFARCEDLAADRMMRTSRSLFVAANLGQVRGDASRVPGVVWKEAATRLLPCYALPVVGLLPVVKDLAQAYSLRAPCTHTSLTLAHTLNQAEPGWTRTSSLSTSACRCNATSNSTRDTALRPVCYSLSALSPARLRTSSDTAMFWS